MRQVWKFEEWSQLTLGKIHDKLLQRARKSPRLGDMTVRELSCLATSGLSPVGIYVLTDEEGVVYVGKTHGRSLHERMVSHVEHREPIPGSPHLARLVQSLIKAGHARDGAEASGKVLDMRVTWLAVPAGDTSSTEHKRVIAGLERRLMWRCCLDPRLNSERLKNCSSFTLRGERFQLTEETRLGAPLTS